MSQRPGLVRSARSRGARGCPTPQVRPSICLSSKFLPQNLVTGRFPVATQRARMPLRPNRPPERLSPRPSRASKDLRDPPTSPATAPSLTRDCAVADVLQLDRGVGLAIAHILSRRGLPNLRAILDPRLRSVAQDRVAP